MAKYDVQQREKAQRKAGQGDGGSFSGTQGVPHRSAQKCKGAKLMQLLSASKRSCVIPNSGSSSKGATAPKGAKADGDQRASKSAGKGDASQATAVGESAHSITQGVASVWDQNKETQIPHTQEGHA